MVGAEPGTEDGVMGVLGEEAKLVPLALVAVTVYVLEIPTVSEIVIGEVAPETVVALEDVAVKVVIDFPPVAPAVKTTPMFAEPVYA
jgi:hypothetical protein